MLRAEYHRKIMIFHAGRLDVDFTTTWLYYLTLKLCIYNAGEAVLQCFVTLESIGVALLFSSGWWEEIELARLPWLLWPILPLRLCPVP